jgi:hypothetical protein
MISFLEKSMIWEMNWLRLGISILQFTLWFYCFFLLIFSGNCCGYRVCLLDFGRLKFVFHIQACQRQSTGWTSKAFNGGNQEKWEQFYLFIYFNFYVLMIRDELGQKPNFWDGIRAHSIYVVGSPVIEESVNDQSFFML